MKLKAYGVGYWTEILGRVEDVDVDSVTFSFTTRVYVKPEELRKWLSLLKKGSVVGLLLLDDGSIRVRTVEVKAHGGSDQR